MRGFDCPGIFAWLEPTAGIERKAQRSRIES